MCSCKSPVGRLESHQRGFWTETVVLCPGDLLTFPKKRWWGDRSPVNVRRVDEKHNVVRQADFVFLGYMLRKYQGENLRSDSTLTIRSLPHDLVTGGIPHAGSRQPPVCPSTCTTLPGASMRNSTRDKVMWQSSDGKANQTSGFPPGIS